MRLYSLGKDHCVDITRFLCDIQLVIKRLNCGIYKHVFPKSVTIYQNLLHLASQISLSF